MQFNKRRNVYDLSSATSVIDLQYILQKIKARRKQNAVNFEMPNFSLSSQLYTYDEGLVNMALGYILTVVQIQRCWNS